MNEDILTSRSGRRMYQTISPIYKDSEIMHWFYQVAGIELDDLKVYAEQINEQGFIRTATWGLELIERLYGIEPDETLSEEERKQRIIMKKTSSQPNNPALLDADIETLTERETETKEQHGAYKIVINLQPGLTLIDTSALFHLIEKKKPAHIDFDVGVENKIQTEITIDTSMEAVAFLRCGEALCGFQDELL